MKKQSWGSLFLLLVLFCITGCSSVGKDDSKKYDININSVENIATKSYVSYDQSQLIVYMTNNYDYDIGSIEIEAIYYDEKGNKIMTDDTSLMEIQKDAQVATYLRFPHDNDYNYYVPAKTELKVTIDEEYQTVIDDIKMYHDKISSEYKVNGDEAVITLKNNADVSLDDVEGIVLFMKGKKPIYAEEIGRFRLNKGSSDSENVDIPIDWEKSDREDVLVDYDDIKVLINRATIEN